MSKRKVKQEVGLVLLFEMFLIGNVKQTNQINIYNLTSIVRERVQISVGNPIMGNGPD